MGFEWMNWSNPVFLWWVFLTSISAINISIWVWSHQYLRRDQSKPNISNAYAKYLIWFSAAYVFICAFRAVLPRADVQKICLFDTWFSSILIGRSVATIAELCFVIQWAIVLNSVARLVNSKPVERVSLVIVPLIIIAECFSWYSVVTTHYLGNTFEESIWAITYALICFCLIKLFAKLKGALKSAVGFSIAGCLLYILFMVTVDVPMYLHRWQLDIESNKRILSLFEGFHELNSTWIVTHDIAQWKTEIPWMSLYFSIAVWVSLALCYVPLTREELNSYRND